MKRKAIRILACTIAVGVGLIWSEPMALGRSRTANDIPECITVRNASQRTGYGYDHVVYVRNDCTAAVECTVGTRRNPKPEFGLVVAPGEESGVVLGTHARTRRFKSWVTCHRLAKTSASVGHGRSTQFGQDAVPLFVVEDEDRLVFFEEEVALPITGEAGAAGGVIVSLRLGWGGKVAASG